MWFSGRGHLMGDETPVRTYLGERVRRYRQMRGLSLRVCADLAGISPSWLSRVERGLRSLERRTHIENLAAVLQISATELLGTPYPPDDPQHRASGGCVEGVRSVLIGTDLGRGNGIAPWRPIEELERLTAEALTLLHRHGDVGAAAVHQPDVLAELHAHVADGRDRDRALRALALAAIVSSSTMRWLGSSDLSWLAAARAREAARALGDPGLIGLAEWRAVGAARPYSLALARVETAIEELDPDVGDDMERLQVLGILHLHASMDAAVVGQAADSRAHFDEATELVARTSGAADPFEIYFGPGNLEVWRLSIAVELGEGGRARELARRVPASVVPSKSRQATYYQDLGRALAQDGHWREATAALLQADRLNPAEIRVNALARGLAMDLLPKLPRAAGGIEVRTLAKRMGII